MARSALRNRCPHLLEEFPVRCKRSCAAFTASLGPFRLRFGGRVRVRVRVRAKLRVGLGLRLYLDPNRKKNT